MSGWCLLSYQEGKESFKKKGIASLPGSCEEQVSVAVRSLLNTEDGRHALHETDLQSASLHIHILMV